MEKEKIEKYMKICINEAKKAFEENEIPVGSLIVINNKIISKSYNKRDSKNIVIEHAEISAIVKANKKLKCQVAIHAINAGIILINNAAERKHYRLPYWC